MERFTATQETLQNGKVIRFQLFENSRILTYTEVIQFWKNEAKFRVFYNNLLANVPFEAYFWELPPVTHASLHISFEFVLINSSHLAKISPDNQTFKGYFSAQETVVNFLNVGRDALLVVPCPVVVSDAYAHIARFVRNAPEEQQNSLWQLVANSIEKQLGNRPLWVSTSGRGVYWLHIRLDSRPKYYQFQPYKVMFTA